MASVSRDSNGTKRVLFIDGDGKRRTIRLGAVSVKVAESFTLKVAALNAANIAGEPIGSDLAAWVRDLPDVTHGKLARAGLVEPRVKAAAVTLGELLNRFEQSAVVKPATKAAYRQTTKSLRAHFGDDMPIASITPADADAWRKAASESGIAPATVAKRVHVAKAIFRKAVKWRLIASSPFDDLKAGSQCNTDRAYYVTPATVDAIMAACPDEQWRAVVALCRWAGLRCPSEIVGLTWGDVNWERGRLAVRSPKTAGHGDGHAMRFVPITPALRSILLRLFEQAEPGAVKVIARLCDSTQNLRTTFGKIIIRAGEKPWPRLFQNMRASCATDWVERFPVHVVAGWLGHSPMIAAQHYLQTRDAHFDLAAGINGGGGGGAECGALVAQNASQHASAHDCAGLRDEPKTPCFAGETHGNADARNHAQYGTMGGEGFEPP